MSINGAAFNGTEHNVSSAIREIENALDGLYALKATDYLPGSDKMLSPVGQAILHLKSAQEHLISAGNYLAEAPRKAEDK